jgi:IS5 family transposase
MPNARVSDVTISSPSISHLGMDSKSKLIQTILASAANVHDRDALPHLLHGARRACGMIKAIKIKRN